jgi:hypothetical protein
MATKVRKSGQTNWLTLAGAAVLVLVVLGAAGYWMDRFGGPTADTAVPASEDTAPARE